MATLATGCFCIAAKLDVCLWMSLFRQKSVFEKSLPAGYHIRSKDVDMCLKSKSMVILFKFITFFTYLINTSN